ncbi:cyclin-K-like [Paramacrobiotus metropolitanus]|uniref:cyclin-K-like n=1 Tax=Paramacrobiotus metropolitanus TaxID=2943436 RepID=UPI002445C454|nr:cyclin-K-like [Paramacrobiotus metropolitanus]
MESENNAERPQMSAPQQGQPQGQLPQGTVSVADGSAALSPTRPNTARGAVADTDQGSRARKATELERMSPQIAAPRLRIDARRSRALPNADSAGKTDASQGNTAPAKKKAAVPLSSEGCSPRSSSRKKATNQRRRRKATAAKVPSTGKAAPTSSVPNTAEPSATPAAKKGGVFRPPVLRPTAWPGFPATGFGHRLSGHRLSGHRFSGHGFPATGFPATSSPATGPPANGPPANGAPATGTPAAGLPATGPPFTGLPTLTPTTRPPPSRPPPTRAQPTRAPRTSGPLTRQPAKRTLSPARFDQEPSTSSGPNGSVRKQQLGPAQKKQRSAAAPDGMHLCNRITKLKVGRKTHPVAHWKSTVLEFRHIDVPSDAELSEEEGELEDFVDARDGQSGYVEARERLEKLREDIQLRGGKRFRCPFCGFLAGSTGRKETVARHVGGIPGHGGQRSCWAWATSDDPVSVTNTCGASPPARCNG